MIFFAKKKMLFECALWTSFFSTLYLVVLSTCRAPLKRQNYIFDLAFFGSTTLLGLYALYCDAEIWQQPFTKKCLASTPPNVSWIVQQLPYINVGYYLCSLALIAWQRTDMAAHHIVTSIAILTCEHLQLQHLIVVHVVAHNVCDVFLLAGKLLQHDKYPQWLSNACMYIFVPIWIYMRLYVVQKYAIWPLVVQNSGDASPLLYKLCLPFVALFEALQLYWTFLILRMAHRKLRNPSTQTVTDDDHGGHDDHKDE